MQRPKTFTTQKAHELIETCSTVGFVDSDWLHRDYSQTPCLRQHYADCNGDTLVCTEMIQFVSGSHPPEYLLCLRDTAGKPIPETLWNQAVTREHHILKGKAAKLIQDLIQHVLREKLPQQPDKPGLQLYRYYFPNGLIFSETVQFVSGEDYFLAVQDTKGQFVGGTLWGREQLHKNHDLSFADMRLIAGSSWREESSEQGAHLCTYMLPDGRQYREFLQAKAWSDGPLYFLGLCKIGAQGEVLSVVENSALSSI
jgi:hypothetical protein